MSGRALVLAAHGSRNEPAVNEQIRQLARRLSEFLPFDEVAVAFHQGSPAFSEVLDTLKSKVVTVIPYMTSAGYYCDTVLPRELARSPRFDSANVQITAPIGLHRDVPSLIASRAALLLESFRLVPAATALVLVGHGTPRHPASRDSTIALAAALRTEPRPSVRAPQTEPRPLGSGRQDWCNRKRPELHLDAPLCSEVISVFLDDVPPVEKTLALAMQPNIMVLPFLIAPGPHATIDIPKRIGIDVGAIRPPPLAASIGSRRVVIDIPFGSYPGMIDLIESVARESSSRRACSSATL